MVESANQFSLEELSRTQYSLKYFSKPYRPSDRLYKNLKCNTSSRVILSNNSADKAANNVIIIWKRYYVYVLKEELNSAITYVPAQLTKDKLLLCHIDTLTKSNIKIDKLDLPTFYWLPKLHKNPYKSRFISNSSHCSTNILSINK